MDISVTDGIRYRADGHFSSRQADFLRVIFYGEKTSVTTYKLFCNGARHQIATSSNKWYKSIENLLLGKLCFTSWMDTWIYVQLHFILQLFYLYYRGC